VAGPSPHGGERRKRGREWAMLSRINSSFFFFPEFHVTTREKFRSENKFQGVVPP
jgi:hypothetical protein